MSRVRIILAGLAAVAVIASAALAPTTQAQTVDMVGILQNTLDSVRANATEEERDALPEEVTYAMVCNYMVLVAGRQNTDCPDPQD